MAARITNNIRVALIQMAVGADKSVNLRHAKELIRKAAMPSNSGVKPLVILPECFNSPYGTQYFGEYSESIPGETTQMLSETAKEEGIFLIGGSIPERRGDKVYNTCTAYNPQGDMILKYSKLHLFDIDIPGKIRFQESEVLTAGDTIGTFQMGDVKVGVGICYDIRFAELAMIMARQGCKLLVYPGAFNMTTGPAHWELLQRGRAVDNQVYVAACSPARDMEATYNAWGHSTVVGPFGDVIASTKEKEDIIISDLDLNRLKEVRGQIPIHYQRREDMYAVTESPKMTKT